MVGQGFSLGHEKEIAATPAKNISAVLTALNLPLENLVDEMRSVVRASRELNKGNIRGSEALSKERIGPRRRGR